MIRFARIAVIGLLASTSAAYGAAPESVAKLCGDACMTACATLGIECGMTDCDM